MMSGSSSTIDSSVASLLMQLFQSMDGDGSSTVSESEFASALTTTAASSTTSDLFSNMDFNDDGELNQLEIAAVSQQFDSANLSVLLSAQEQGPTRPQDLFALMDANVSGTVDEDEFIAAAEEAGSQLSSEQLEELFAEIDANGDGAIDGEEFSTAAQNAAPPPPAAGGLSSGGEENYDSLDTNKDGIVSLEELLAAGVLTENTGT